jgi:hypothetical protein
MYLLLPRGWWVREASSDTHKVTDEGIRDQQVDSGAGVQLLPPAGICINEKRCVYLSKFIFLVVE